MEGTDLLRLAQRNELMGVSFLSNDRPHVFKRNSHERGQENC